MPAACNSGGTQRKLAPQSHFRMAQCKAGGLWQARLRTVLRRSQFREGRRMLDSLAPLTSASVLADLPVCDAPASSVDSFRLPAACPVPEAVRRALARPAASLFDPIAVERPDGGIQWLDMSVLLLAHARLLEHANEMLHRQKEDA